MTPSKEGLELRKLLLDATKLDGVTIDDAKAVVLEAVGVKSLKDVPPEKAGDAIAALKVFIAEKS